MLGITYKYWFWILVLMLSIGLLLHRYYFKWRYAEYMLYWWFGAGLSLVVGLFAYEII